MQSLERDAPFIPKKEKPKSAQHKKMKGQKSVDMTPIDIEDDNDHSIESSAAINQLVLYNPHTSDKGQEVQPVPDPIECRPQSSLSLTTTSLSSRVLPSVGAFTVQCAICFKWRLIPTKEIYEEIRETILQDPFTCKRAREWRPAISCDDPADISQDGSRLWAIDKPNIAQPPPRWERILRIRGEGSTKFADVYYAAPSGKRLRSMVEIQKYLIEHPEYIEEGVNLSQFSFQTPKPLQENYVRKRSARVANPRESHAVGFPGPMEPAEVSPIAWAGPDACTELRIGQAGLSSPFCEPLAYHSLLEQPPAKKRSAKPASKQTNSASLVNQAQNNVKDSPKGRNASSCEL